MLKKVRFIRRASRQDSKTAETLWVLSGACLTCEPKKRLSQDSLEEECEIVVYSQFFSVFTRNSVKMGAFRSPFSTCVESYQTDGRIRVQVFRGLNVRSDVQWPTFLLQVHCVKWMVVLPVILPFRFTLTRWPFLCRGGRSQNEV